MARTHYSEFRQGKLVGPRDSRYGLIAHTTDLTDDSALEKLAQIYSFWGTRPPAGSRWAVGITAELNGLMLMKKVPAVDRDGRAAISGDRSFDISRHVILPKDKVTTVIAAQSFRLFDWILKDPNQLQSEVNHNLTTPEIPLLEEPSSEPISFSEMLARSAQIKTAEGEPLLLLALSALLDEKRLLLTFDQASLDFWKSLLLLLPAASRSEIAIAMGTVDESSCRWAHIIVKDGPSSTRSRPKNFLKVNLSTQSLEGDWVPKQSHCKYVELLKPLLDSPETVSELIQALDAANDVELSLTQVAEANLPVGLQLSLTKLLPDGYRQERLTQFFAQLSDQAWPNLLPLLDQSEVRQSAWTQLCRRASANVEKVGPWMYQLWPSLEAPIQKDFLAHLSSQPTAHLTTAWIQTALLNAEPTVADVQLAKCWLHLCQSAIKEKAAHLYQAALEMAKTYAKCKIFQTSDRFWLIDTVLSGNILPEEANRIFNDDLSPLLVNITELEKSHLYQHFVKNLVKIDASLEQVLPLLNNQKIDAIAHLPTLATLTNMPAAQQDKFYISFLQALSPTFEQAKGLFDRLIEQRQLFQIQAQPTCQALSQTIQWFTNHQPSLGTLLTEFQQIQPSWPHLMRLAEIFRDTPKTQLQYADHLVKKYAFTALVVPAICEWLEQINAQSMESSFFQTNSELWKSLSQENVGAIAAISPNLMTVLGHELCRANRMHDIAGGFLHHLVAHWQAGHPVDNALLALVSNRTVTRTYTDEDWLAIANFCWSPKTKYPISNWPEALTPQSKRTLVNRAKKIVSTCNEPQWIEQVMIDSSNWHLDLDAQREILATAKPNTCSITLIRRLLNEPNNAVDISSQSLIRLLSQTTPQSPEECQDYQQVLTAAMLHGLKTNTLPPWLQEPSAVSRPGLYQVALSNVFQALTTDSIQTLKSEHQRMCQAFPTSAQKLGETLKENLAIAFSNLNL